MSGRYSLSQSSKNGAQFDRALGVIKSERRRYEQERAEWDVERIRLKAQISAYEKRIELLGTQYMAAQRQISILESLVKRRSNSSNSSSSSSGDSKEPHSTTDDNNAGAIDSVHGLVKETERRRERSRMLLERCLEEIDVLLAPQSLLESPSAAAATAGMRRRSSVDAMGPNGVIESEIASTSPGLWQMRLTTSVSAPIIGEPADMDRSQEAHSAAVLVLDKKRNGRKATRAFESQEFSKISETGPAQQKKTYSGLVDLQNNNKDKPSVVTCFPTEEEEEEATEDGDDDDGEEECEYEDEEENVNGSIQSIQDIQGIQSIQENAVGRELEKLIKVDEVDVVPAKAQSQWQIQKSFTGHLDTVRSICVREAHSEDTAQMLSGSDDGMVILWDIERGSRRKSRKRPTGDITPQYIFRGHLASVTSVVWDSAHDFAYSGSLDSSIKAWAVPKKDDDPEACFAARGLFGHTDAVWDLALSVRGGLLASVGADRSCRLWSIDPHYAAEPVRRVVSSSEVPASAVFVDDSGARVAVGYVSGEVTVFDTETGTAAVSVSGLPRVTKIAWNSDNLVAAACVDGSARICDLRSGDSAIALARPFIGSNDILTAIDIVAGQPCAVAGGSDGVVTWWDWRNPMQRDAANQVFRHRTKGDEGVCSVQAFSSASGEQYVASAGSDARVYFSKRKG